MDLLNRFEREFPEVEVAYLCGDREFIGQPWLTYLLLDPIIRFRLRIRETDLINDGQKQFPAKTVFAHLQPGQQEILNSRRWGGRDARIAFGHFSRPFWGRLVYVSALRLEDGELLIVISPDSPETAISDYANRWGIETLFGMFKTRGFCLESTHFTDPQRPSQTVGSHVFGDVLGDESWGMVALSHSSQGALSDARETRARVAPQSEETWAKRKKSFSLWS